LDEPGIPRLLKDEDKSSREINRYTLFGEYDAAFVALLVTRLKQDGITTEQLDEYCVAHMNRGVQLLAGRLKSISDLRLLAAPVTANNAPEATVKITVSATRSGR
jgi:hypothetical protein